MFEYNRYRRNAYPGEWVWFYPRGERVENERVLALVVKATGQTLSLETIGERRTRFEAKQWTRHIDDPHWKGRESQRSQLGAWDFHEIYGPMFNSRISALHASAARMERLQKDKAELTADEFTALEALNRLGPVMSHIAEDTGFTVGMLNNMPSFKSAFTKRKVEAWEARQPNPAIQQDDDDDIEISSKYTFNDDDYATNWKKAAERLGISYTEWDELKTMDGFPGHAAGKGWPVKEIQAWRDSLQPATN